MSSFHKIPPQQLQSLSCYKAFRDLFLDCIGCKCNCQQSESQILQYFFINATLFFVAFMRVYHMIQSSSKFPELFNELERKKDANTFQTFLKNVLFKQFSDSLKHLFTSWRSSAHLFFSKTLLFLFQESIYPVVYYANTEPHERHFHVDGVQQCHLCVPYLQSLSVWSADGFESEPLMLITTAEYTGKTQQWGSGFKVLSKPRLDVCKQTKRYRALNQLKTKKVKGVITNSSSQA